MTDEKPKSTPKPKAKSKRIKAAVPPPEGERAGKRIKA